MAERRTTVDGLADAIMDGLKEYADLATGYRQGCGKGCIQDREEGYTGKCPEADWKV